ncbi:MAG: metal ABC transporter permease [Oscillatoriaceae bacterium SKW80]|nr:metal ABC transporter permease [Oscillatoriaceae bacterium SKYG93]MCX8120535.1 metal ABC transporter permease [Oscillatoriaceae bacterium SKW80]MDW8452773.1 metal ABC transporter permease [Oscillatoriaceae cyanobacterium SKYGB_i_bin93]HIK27157.1 metal ABC transporter permease [Oscillatoriaceae cyanobacterium M7585_C2015_266]
MISLNYWLAVTDNPDFFNLLQFPFMQRALAGSLLMGLLGGLLGSFVTLRQLSFFSHAVSHAALVGVVIGVLLNINPTWTLLPFTLAFGILVLYLIDKTDLASDSVFSIALSAALAIGIILTRFIPNYRGNLMGVLFGDILAISQTDIILILLLLVVSTIFLLSTLRQQILLTLNPSVAQAQGIPVQLHRYIFLILLSLAVAVAIKAVGLLLVNAFLVIPASTAKLLSHRFDYFLTFSVILGAVSSIIGILLSGAFNFASGPSIVLAQFLLFLAILSWTHFRLEVKK